MMSLVSDGLKHAAAVGGASGCVTEESVLPGLTRESGEEHQLPGDSVASTEGGKFEREVCCQKRYLITRIGELGQELSLGTNRREVLLCWDKLENLGEDVSKFHQLLNDNGDTAASADVQDKVGLTFESLKLKCRDKMNQILEQPHSEVQPENSMSNVGTALSRSSANALIQIDLELQREELQIEAKKSQAQMQAQMQAEFEPRDAKLRAEQCRQEILATSSFREGSRISHKSRLSSRKSYSGTGPDVAAIFGRNKKVDNQVVAPRTGETDLGLGAAGDASHLVEPLRGIACGETALSEPLGSNAILNDFSNPAAQTENCVVPSAATNPFTQSTLLFLDEMVCLLVEPVNVRGRPEQRCHQDSSVASFRIQGRVKYYHHVGPIVMYLNVCGI